MNIPLSLIEKAKDDQPWDLENQTIYDLCRKYPNHIDEKAIIAKVWLIGRTYAAAIERRKSHKELEGDAFYIKHVAPKIRSSKIDKWFASLENYKEINRDNLGQILDVNHKLTELFRDLTGEKKRSLASKYLHFHFPKLFFIYDTRAETASKNKLFGISANAKSTYKNADDEYRSFCSRCVQVLDNIYEQHERTLTPRELDNLLLVLPIE